MTAMATIAPARPAVLLIVFNRPAETKRVLERIIAFHPPRLYVAADGARDHVATDAVSCAETRALLASVPATIPVTTLFREKNLGCKAAVSGAISWFFDHEECGVILEDDCLPMPAFYDYMTWALDRFRRDPRVWHISAMGVPLANGARLALMSMPFIWGWASWSDRWKNYRVKFADSPADIRRVIAEISPLAEVRDYWFDKITAANSGAINTWDYQWVYAIWRSHALCLTPAESLVDNIGFGEAATHSVPGTEMDFTPASTIPWSIPAPDHEVAEDRSLLPMVQKRIFRLTRGNLRYRLYRASRHPLVRIPQLALANRLRRILKTNTNQ